MKKGLFILLLAAASAFAGYWIYYGCATRAERTMLKEAGGEMQWLRREYHLTDAQFARIEEMHRAYAPKCGLMCQKIAKADVKLDQLISASKTVTPEVAAALKESAAVQEECREAMLGHIYAVSAAMPPEEGARYLQMMKGHIIQPGALNQATAISESAK